MLKRAAACAGLLIMVVLSSTAGTRGNSAAEPPLAWEPMGLSGGGAMFTPAISPADPRHMMINCDMSAAYLSDDGGMHWRMINAAQLRASTRCRPAFHPTDPRTIYAADGSSGLKVTHDGGEHWRKIGSLPTDMRGEVAVDATSPVFLLAGTASGIFASHDAGNTWTHCDGPSGEPISFHFDLNEPAAPGAAFAATSTGIWRSDDGGKNWMKKGQGLPDAEILSFSGGSNVKQRLEILYCTVPGTVIDGRYAGGVYRSLDRGETWQPALGTGLNLETKAFDEWAMGPIAEYRRIVTTDARPNTVFAFNSNTGIPPPHHATAYRSDDAGKTWRATFQADPRYPGMNVEPDYTVDVDGQYYQDVPAVAATATDPDRMLLVTMGGCYITANGGKTWECGHARPAPGAANGQPRRWLCNGLVVTTTWNYYIDPFEPNRHYICYTDIGFAHSEDRGRSWQWWAQRGRAPWQNTCYQLAFDPQAPGLVWGAFSNTHDIPNGNIIYGNHRADLPGGVCVSDDHCLTWRKSNAGLPAAPVTSVVVDPRSRRGSRVLYAGLFGAGVYKSIDNGKSWSARNMGLGVEGNRRVCQIALHTDGTLFALITARREGGRFQQDGVGLYRSTDGADDWSLVNGSMPLLWPKGFTIDPRDSRAIYVSACNGNGEEQSGLYRTTDGGLVWNRIGREGSEHFGAFLSPAHRGWIYMTLTEGAPGAGLWLSRDNGATWKPMSGLPFSNAQRVTFDPRDPALVYVTTFGGSVWKGPAAGP